LPSYALAALGVVMAAAGCGRPSADRAQEQGHSQPAPVPLPPPAPSPPPGPPSLPEDPAKAKQSEQQWQQHMRDEENERQLGFDRSRLKQHRALVERIASARAEYDRARSEAAVAKVHADMPRQLADMHQRVTEIDHWGTNSRLLGDYAALQALLADPYAQARSAAIRGDTRALAQARAEFDRHMKTIHDWLEQAAESDGE
jgi:hypothetical protein